MDMPDLYWQMADMLRRVQARHMQAVQPFCAQHCLTPLGLRALGTLHFEGPQTVSALARLTGVAGANISALCKRLAGQGLVQRRRGRQDERQVLISLTPQGEQLFEAFLQDCTADFKKRYERIAPPRQAAIAEGLCRLRAMLDALEENSEETHT